MFLISKKWNMAFFTILHLIVDGLCSLVIFQKLYTNDYQQCLIVFLCYNFLAFLSQPFVGLFIDKKNHPKVFLLISMLFLLLGVCSAQIVVLSAILLGIGNSFFHISGGKYVIEKSHNDISLLGVFVSTGVIGLTLGQHYASKALWIIFLIFLVIFTLFIILSKEKDTNVSIHIEEQETIKKREKKLILVLLIFIVMIRSFVGKILILDFSKTSFIFLLIAIFTSLGKALGGIFVKWLKMKKTILFSMILAIFCFMFPSNIYLTLIGIAAFNFTMPITLWYANELYRKNEGLAFGLLAAFLIPGYLLGMLEYTTPIVYFLVIFLSSLSLIFILLIDRKNTYVEYH